MGEKNNKNHNMLVLGILAVIAVFGLVLMFVQNNEAAGLSFYYGPKVYSGGAKEFYHEYSGDVYYDPYKHPGPTKTIYTYIPGEGLVGKAIQTQHFGYDPAALTQIPTYLETRGMLGPLSIQEAAALKSRGEPVSYTHLTLPTKRIV